MEIKYLKIVEENPNIGISANIGFSIEKIELIEQKYNNGKKFPQALREFLYLAGDYNGFGFDTSEGIEDLQEKAKKIFSKYGNHIGRPYFVVSKLNGLDTISFIYLDTNEEDPFVYHCDPYFDEKYEEQFIYARACELSKLIKNHIEIIISEQKYYRRN
ncbi:hypothetical protein [Aureivirga sp. CE67]|uniref:hypothetical protein n=1 Tax=Aureivirga sp. CE67 TaxID=1788983 RepID=UPI0018C9FAD6|nr:hypothetical protein [Aureivirga sp. CE67]